MHIFDHVPILNTLPS